MNQISKYYKTYSLVNSSDKFNSFALRLFKYQSKNNQVYKKYIELIGKNSNRIDKIESIPFLPIEFYKNHAVKSGNWNPQTYFLSSGTTSLNRSKHFIQNLKFYQENTYRIFNQFYGNPEDFIFVALLPSYEENKHSSLLHMVRHLIHLSKSKYSRFYKVEDIESLIETDNIKKTNKRIFLLGATFSLLKLAEKGGIDLKNVIIMETGGMKGQGKEMVRKELHSLFKDSFNVKAIHSEYGMTELMSQAYSLKEGYFTTPGWMKVLIRDLNDPFALCQINRPGGINIIDLANISTCSFIETQDLGLIHKKGIFEVLGRVDNSEIRGCNLLVT